MIEDMFFCVISIVVGGYLVSQKLRAIPVGGINLS